MKATRKDSGFSAIVLLIVMSVLVVGLFVGWLIYRTKRTTSEADHQSLGVMQECIDKPKFTLPVDAEEVTQVLYPGQVRGGDYKPHGGLRVKSPINEVVVKLPINSKLIDGSRYIEQGEVQYLLDFETNCKIRMRFDHLSVLSLELMSEVSKLPEAKENDSRTFPLSGKDYTAGEIIASRVGIFKNNNAGFDFGLYDYNHENKISEDLTWSADPMHQTDNARHAVCWIDYLVSSDKVIIEKLPAGDQISGKTSDYCTD